MRPPLPPPRPFPFPLPRATATATFSASTAVNPSIVTSNKSPPTDLPNASKVNMARIKTVAQRLALHFQSGVRPDPSELFQLCFHLARGIDYAVSHDDFAPINLNLPTVIKKVYQHKDDFFLRVAILVLLISVKNACRKKWFCSDDSAELTMMANEMSSSFCNGDKITSQSNKSLGVMSKVMQRYFPQLKLNHLICYFEVKAGYDILVTDVCIPRNLVSTGERIRLFVVQLDNIQSSACLITPSQANFLINGKGVDRRSNISLDTGPQIPTDITKMLKYGLNLFQVAGSFNGNYIVTISVMKAIPCPDAHILHEYVQPNVPMDVSDTEIIEGPSRIFLNCPISHKRIKTPIKGHLCKHHQCFDFNTYMEMNSTKPSWRCPHCNQSVSYEDIRIDKNMVKILAEAGESVSIVIVSADGSWKADEENQNNASQTHKHALKEQRDISAFSDPSGITCKSNGIMDLTTEENFESNIMLKSRHSDFDYPEQKEISPCEITDKRPLQNNDMSGTIQPTLQVGNNICSGQTRQVQRPSIPRHITRSPIAVQGLPAMQSNTMFKRPRTSEINTFISHPNCSRASQPVFHEGFNNIATSGIPLVVQPHSPSSSQLCQQTGGVPAHNHGSTVSSERTRAVGHSVSSLPPHLDIHRSRDSLQQLLNAHGHQTLSQLATSIRSSNSIPSTNVHQAPQYATSMGGMNSANPIAGNQQSYLTPGKTPNAPLMSRLHPGVLSPQSFMTISLPPATVNRSRPTVNELVHDVGGSQQSSMNNHTSSSTEVGSDANWRPTGRMRGSLTGEAYSAALSRYTVQTSQAMTSTPIPTARGPASNLSSATHAPNSNDPADRAPL